MVYQLPQNGTETILIGPLVLSTDGITKATGLNIPASEVLISKNGGALAPKTDTTDCTEDSNGFYTAVLGPADLDTAGTITVTLATTGVLAWWKEYQVGEDVFGQAPGKGLSTCLIKLGPYLTKPNGLYETTAVSGVIIDIYTGNPPGLGEGAISVATWDSGEAQVIFSPGTSKTTWFARATYPAGSWDPDRPSYVYVDTTAIN